MNIQPAISSSHPIFTTIPHVLEIMKPLNKLGISYFTYTRTEANGRRIYLTTHQSVMENYLSKKLFLVGNTESSPLRYQLQIVLWDTLPKQYIYDDARSHGIDHGMFFIKPNPTYCEFFGFATKRGNSSIVNIYLSKLDLFKKFTDYFLDKAAPLIKQVEAKKIILPFHKDKLDFIQNDICTDKLLSSISTNDSSPMISKRQFECAQLLVAGKKIKEISAILNLSPRTVDHYLTNLKNKFKCKNKIELILRLSQMNII